MSAPGPINLRMSPTEWGLLLALSFMWGCSFLFQKIAVGEMQPFTVAFGRVAGGALILAIFLRVSGRSLVVCLPVWRSLLIMGFLNNVVPFSLIIWGQAYITAGLASILIATTPIFAVLIAHVATSDEKLTAGRLAGCVAGFFGVVIVLGPDLLRDIGTNVVAQLAVLGGALFYAISGIYARRFRALPTASVATGSLIWSAIILGILVAVVDRPWALPMPSMTALGAVLGLAVISTALAFIVFFRLIAMAGATNALLVNLLLPVTAILLGALILGEQLEPRQLAGMAMIAVGFAFIDGRLPEMAARKFIAATRGS